MNKDNLRLGLVIGFIAPFLGTFLYYLLQFRDRGSYRTMLTAVMENPSILTAFVSVSLVANAVAFTYYLNQRKDRTAKGIFIVTCIYGVASLLWKWFA